MTDETMRDLALAEIQKGIAKARAAYPENIPAYAESMAASTLRITPLDGEKDGSERGSALPK